MHLGRRVCSAAAQKARGCLNARPSSSVPMEAPSEASVQSDEGASRGAEQAATEAHFMRRAVELSRTALGRTSPNPMVGCVIVKEGRVIGEGFHPKAGKPHAEVFALRAAGDAAAGATAYVSLEPCNHTGRTPPCSRALVAARVARVVVGAVDPNPLVGGAGIETLRAAGIEVTVGVEEALCRANVEAFMFRIVNKRPMTTLLYETAMDGGVAGSWEEDASASEAGSHYSKLLAECDAVVVTDVALQEERRCLSSEPGAAQPLRIVVARSPEINLDHSIFDTREAPTLVCISRQALGSDGSSASIGPSMDAKGVEVVVLDKLSLESVMQLCYERGACSVLLDGRGREASHLGAWALESNAVNKVSTLVRPFARVPRQGGSLADLMPLDNVRTRTSPGGCVIIDGLLHRS